MGCEAIFVAAGDGRCRRFIFYCGRALCPFSLQHQRRRCWFFAIAIVIVGIVGAYFAWTGWSRARDKADEVARTFALRDLVTKIQHAIDSNGAGRADERSALLEELRAVVAHPLSHAILSDGTIPEYELVWDGSPITAQDRATTLLVREAVPTRDGRRAVAFADGTVAFVDR